MKDCVHGLRRCYACDWVGGRPYEEIAARQLSALSWGPPCTEEQIRANSAWLAAQFDKLDRERNDFYEPED